MEPGLGRSPCLGDDLDAPGGVRSPGRHGGKHATVDFSGPVQAAFNATGQYVSAKDQVQEAGAYTFQLVR